MIACWMNTRLANTSEGNKMKMLCDYVDRKEKTVRLFAEDLAEPNLSEWKKRDCVKAKKIATVGLVLGWGLMAVGDLDLLDGHGLGFGLGLVLITHFAIRSWGKDMDFLREFKEKIVTGVNLYHEGRYKTAEEISSKLDLRIEYAEKIIRGEYDILGDRQ